MARTTRGKTRGLGLVAVLVALVAVLPAAGALARGRPTNEFSGICQVAGDETTTNPSTGAFTFNGSGTCTGQLNGDLVLGLPIQVAESGTVAVIANIPTTGTASGVVSAMDPSTGRKIRLRFTAQQVGAVVYATCRAGGNFVAAFAPTNAPSATANHLVGVALTVTSCRS